MGIHYGDFLWGNLMGIFNCTLQANDIPCQPRPALASPALASPAQPGPFSSATIFFMVSTKP